MDAGVQMPPLGFGGDAPAVGRELGPYPTVRSMPYYRKR